jgi:hypothetical protein
MHKSEVGMRDEIGVERILIGRDYPHTEGDVAQHRRISPNIVSRGFASEGFA